MSAAPHWTFALCQGHCGAVRIADLIPDDNSPPGLCPNCGDQTCDCSHCEAEIAEDLQREIDRLSALLNSPELVDFAGGVVREAAHQRERWAAEHDGGKEPADWFWLIGYLAQKAMMAQIAGDADKAKHHCISTAAAIANWHAQLLGVDNSMRPGIAPPDGGVA